MKDKLKAKKGFTLLEVVISVALLAMVSMAFYTIIMAITGTQRRADVYDSMTQEYVERYNMKNDLDDHPGENKYTTTDYMDITQAIGQDKSGNDVEITLYAKAITTGDSKTTEEVRGSKYNAGRFFYYK